MSSTSTAPGTTRRRRLIVTEGDGAGTDFRRARHHTAHTAVYVAADDDSRPEQFGSPSVTLTVEPDGAWSVTARHPFTDGTVVATGHADQVPAVLPADGPESTPLAWVRYGQIHVGDVASLAEDFEGCDEAGEARPAVVYAPTDTGALVPVRFEITPSGFSADDWAYATVTVHLADGVAVTASWRIDGRA